MWAGARKVQGTRYNKVQGTRYKVQGARYKVQVSSLRASLVEGSESHGLRRSTRVSRSVYEAVSRLNNVCGVSRSQRASNLNLCESRFGWLNIEFSELILCILFKVGWYKVTSPAHERGVRATRRHREGRFPQGPHGAVKSCVGAFHRTWNGPNSACR